MIMNEDMKFWESVSKTDPKYTKKANVKGNKITSICAQSQVLKATEAWGLYGKTWGFKDIKFSYELIDYNLVNFKAIFFYPKGEFPIVNAINLYMDKNKTILNDNFAKVVETDTLTKALSKLGFNADVFLGKFDDARYVEEVKKEFNKNKPKPSSSQFNKFIERLKESKDPKEHQNLLTNFKQFFDISEDLNDQILEVIIL